MNVTFVRPNMNDERSFDAMEPLALALLAGHTPDGVETVLYDERIEPVDFDAPTDLVAITVETYTARRAYEISSEFRRRGLPVVMGGFHPTFLPAEALLFADAVVLGDGERVWPEVVRDTAQGRLRRVYRDRATTSLEGLRFDRSIFREKGYVPIRPVQFGRGCRFACDFCSIHAFHGSVLRQRPVRELVSEIGELEARYVFLVDDNLFVNHDEAAALFRALRPLGVKWICQVSIDISGDQALLDLMADCGCAVALVGFESLHPENLSQMGKAWNLRYGSYEEAIGRFRERGMMVYGTFVFGYDRDTVDSLDATVDFAIRSKLCLANFNPLTPTPGVRLYDRLRKQGRLRFDRWWLDPGFRYGDATFHPAGMSADELTEGCYRARKKFNTWGSLARRALDVRGHAGNLGLYLTANWLSRKEIHRKQGMPLGTGAALPATPASLTRDLYRRRREAHAR